MSDDLEAKFVIARDDVRKLDPAYRLAFDLDLGYGIGAAGWEPSRRHDTESPALSDGTRPPLASAVHTSLRHLEQAHHWYGELGQTIWPDTPFCDTPVLQTCSDDCQHLRTPTMQEALEGCVLLAIVLAVLQQQAPDFVSVQETVYALQVADHASQALHVLPGTLWKPKPRVVRLCVDCGRECQELNRSRCYACRKRLVRTVAPKVTTRR